MSLATMFIHRVKVLRPVLEPTDYLGAKQNYGVIYGRMPCRMVPLNAQERYEAAQRDVNITMLMSFYIDYNVLPSDRIEFNNEVYEVVFARINSGSTSFKQAELRIYRAT